MLTVSERFLGSKTTETVLLILRFLKLSYYILYGNRSVIKRYVLIRKTVITDYNFLSRYY